jgi:hypothetical protein
MRAVMQTQRTMFRPALAGLAVIGLSLGATACSDDDGNNDDIDNPLDGVDDQIDDGAENIEENIDSETDGGSRDGDTDPVSGDG